MVDDGRITCSTPAPGCGPGACAEVVEGSLNSESYSSSGVPFTFYNITILSLDVASGPSSGGTMINVHRKVKIEARALPCTGEAVAKAKKNHVPEPSTSQAPRGRWASGPPLGLPTPSGSL